MPLPRHTPGRVTRDSSTERSGPAAMAALKSRNLGHAGRNVAGGQPPCGVRLQDVRHRLVDGHPELEVAPRRLDDAAVEADHAGQNVERLVAVVANVRLTVGDRPDGGGDRIPALVDGVPQRHQVPRLVVDSGRRQDCCPVSEDLPCVGDVGLPGIDCVDGAVGQRAGHVFGTQVDHRDIVGGQPGRGQHRERVDLAAGSRAHPELLALEVACRRDAGVRAHEGRRCRLGNSGHQRDRPLRHHRGGDGRLRGRADVGRSRHHGIERQLSGCVQLRFELDPMVLEESLLPGDDDLRRVEVVAIGQDDLFGCVRRHRAQHRGRAQGDEEPERPEYPVCRHESLLSNFCGTVCRPARHLRLKFTFALRLTPHLLATCAFGASPTGWCAIFAERHRRRESHSARAARPTPGRSEP